MRTLLVAGANRRDLLATGKPNQAIAAELVISLDTVKSHAAHISRRNSRW